MSWIQPRNTKLEEDLAYSLLGIFGVDLPLRYGEGKKTAFERLRKEIDKFEKCVQDLRLIDPHDHKKHIEHKRGGLLEISYRWILEHPYFQDWSDDRHSQLLWIKGNPGKGKTMLLCGIINELNDSALLSYFFCEATNSQTNNAVSVLRGLIYSLILQQPSLVSHVRKKYDYAGKALFEDANAWFALSDIFTDILLDHNSEGAYIIIDALDECVAADLPKLADFIAKNSSVSSRVKWLVSSRNWPMVEERLDKAGSNMRLCLELNTASLAAAVNIYIQHKVSQLARDKKYDDMTRDAVTEHLLVNADDTFLWISLVCQSLETIPRWNVHKKLNMFPPGLDSLYGRMMGQICDSEDAALCKRILALVVTVYEPITLLQLTALIQTLERVSEDLESLRNIVGLCGSFLTIREDTIYFVHQSAKDFLLAKASDIIFPSGSGGTHHEIFLRSLDVMFKTLRRDIYALGRSGFPIVRVQVPTPDPLMASRYSCLYWIDHLCEWERHAALDHKVDLQDGGTVDVFLKKKYLYWLEALSLCKSMSKGVLGISRLEKIIQETDATALWKFVYDARRFIMYHKQAIEISPLQVYTSALIFSPSGSLVRSHFSHEEPDWITIQSNIGTQWSSCMQTLEGHGDAVNSVAFSHDSTQLASASDDSTVIIWDVGSGSRLRTLKGHNRRITSVAFSYKSVWLASASYDSNIRIWDPSSGACLQILESHNRFIHSVAFSREPTRLISLLQDHTIMMWDVGSGMCLQTMKGYSSFIRPMAFSHDSGRLASASHGLSIKIWHTSSGTCLQTLEGHTGFIRSAAFSHDSTQLVSASSDRTLRIWDAKRGACLLTLDVSPVDFINSVAFSHDSAYLVSASDDHTIRIWDASSGVCLQTLKGHTGPINSVTFSHESALVVSASRDRTLRIRDISNFAHLQTLDMEHSDTVHAVAFSDDSTLLASASHDQTIKIWDAGSRTCLNTVEIPHPDVVSFLAFSRDLKCLMVVPVWKRRTKTYFLDVGSAEGWRNPGMHPFVWKTSSDMAHIRWGDLRRRYDGDLALNQGWIKFRLRKLVWLPPEYRPSCSAISGNMISIGVGSGQVWLCKLKDTDALRRELSS